MFVTGRVNLRKRPTEAWPALQKSGLGFKKAARPWL